VKIFAGRSFWIKKHCVMLHTVAGPSTDKEALPAILNAVPTAKEFVHDYALLKYFCTF
jgi:hypothetical protein